MDFYSNENKKKKERTKASSLYTEYKEQLTRIEDYIAQIDKFKKPSELNVLYEGIAEFADVIEEVGYKVKVIKSFCTKYKVPYKTIQPYVESSEDNTAVIVFDRDQFIVKYKLGSNSSVISENYLIYLRYRLEDENENVRWVLEIDRRNYDEPLTLEVTNAEFSNAKKMKELFLSKKLMLNITDAQLTQLHGFLLNQGVADTRKVIRLGYDEVSQSFVFANGVYYHDKFEEPNENGIVEIDDIIISVPFTKKMAEKESIVFIPNDGSIELKEWIKYFTIAHTPKVALPCLCFYFFSIYRDIMINILSFSPILFLKGLPGSGKSTIVRQLLQLFCIPPSEGNINLKTKNTEASIARNMSSTSNCMLWVDEYHTEAGFDGMFQAAYDNMGLQKAKMDKSGTHNTGNAVTNTPPKSALVMTSNFFPKEDEILFSRMVYLPVNKTKHDEITTEANNKIEFYKKKGLSWVTCEMQKYRPDIEKRFYKEYNRIVNVLKHKLVDEDVMDRLILNQGAIIAPFLIINSITPLTEIANLEDYIVGYAAQQIAHQHHTMKKNSPLRSYFEILQLLFNENRLRSGVVWKIVEENDIKYLVLRFDTIWGAFKERYMRQYNRVSPDQGSIEHEFRKYLEIPDDDNIGIYITSSFYPTSGGGSNSKPYNCNKCIKIPYEKTMEMFGIEFEIQKS